MRHALLATFAVILFAAGCKDGDSCDGACKTTDAKYGMNERTVHAVDQHAFAGFDGLDYTLVRVEYGNVESCDSFDENCSFSVYCGFIVGGEEFPVYGDFVADEDVLFDEAYDLTGLDLAIFDDAEFDDWLNYTDDEDDILIECFSDY